MFGINLKSNKSIYVSDIIGSGSIKLTPVVLLVAFCKLCLVICVGGSIYEGAVNLPLYCGEPKREKEGIPHHRENFPILLPTGRCSAEVARKL